MGIISVIGGGGYVGCQLLEHLVLKGESGHRAIVRAYRSMAGLARFGNAVNVEIADAEDPQRLADAIKGSCMVVNLTTGPPTGIIRSTKSIYQACVAAKVPRLVHMSSAVVFGDVEDPTIDDDSTPGERHWMPYARAKSVAEKWLRINVNPDECQVAVLRPGIVWGIRSPHTLSLVDSLAKKNAYLVDSGRGVFNGIFIDNLLACILACRDELVDITGHFNVSDDEAVTWRDFYHDFAIHLGCDMKMIPAVSGERMPISVGSVVDRVQSVDFVNRAYHKLKSQLPDQVKSTIKARLAGAYCYERVASQYNESPAVEREHWHLQRVRFPLTNRKFAEHFDFKSPVSFEEGMHRTIQWLFYLGYGGKYAS